MYNISFPLLYDIIHDIVYNSNMDCKHKHSTTHLLCFVLCSMRNDNCITQIEHVHLPPMDDLSPDLMNNLIDKIIIRMNIL